MAKPPNPIFHVTFTDTTTATIAGGTATATVTGSPEYRSTSFGNGILVYTNEVVRYDSTGNLPSFNRQGCIDFWVRTQTEFGADGDRYYFYCGNNDQSSFMAIYDNASSLLFTTKAAGVEQISINTTPAWKTNEEHHIIAIWNFTTQYAYFYVDNQLIGVDSSFTTAVAQDANFYIGSMETSGNEADDIITDFRIYDIALTGAQKDACFARRKRLNG